MDYPILSSGQLSAQLRALRKTRHMSQGQLGAALGVGFTRVTRIEHDPSAISVGQLFDVLEALGVQMVLRPIGSSITGGRQPLVVRHVPPAIAAADSGPGPVPCDES